jgi:hypothetical protein
LFPCRYALLHALLKLPPNAAGANSQRVDGNAHGNCHLLVLPDLCLAPMLVIIHNQRSLGYPQLFEAVQQTFIIKAIGLWHLRRWGILSGQFDSPAFCSLTFGENVLRNLIKIESGIAFPLVDNFREFRGSRGR